VAIAPPLRSAPSAQHRVGANAARAARSRIGARAAADALAMVQKATLIFHAD